MQNRSNRNLLAAALLGLGLALPDAHAMSQPVEFNELLSSATLSGAFGAGDNLLLNTLVTTDTGALLQSVAFTVDAGVSSFTGSAAWEITPAASAGPRLVGVNIDVLDAANNVLATDTFAGVLGGFAISTFAANLGPGTYRLVASGTAVRASSLDVSLSFVGAQAPTNPASLITNGVRTKHLESSATVATPFTSNDTLFLDTLVTTETGALNQRITFTVDAGVGAFTGEASWEVSAAAGTGPRLSGVNIDILDAANNIVATDTLDGLLGGFALSSLAGNLGPGTYTLVATGTAIRDASLNVSLTFGATAVPEPQTYALMVAGLGAMGAVVRRRHTQRR